MNLFKCAACGIEFKSERKKRITCSITCSGKLKERPIPAKLWEKVVKTDTCWNWVGSINTGNNYGIMVVGLGHCKRKNLLVHRISWELHFGPIPEGQCVLHKCDNRRCVNPDHLFLGTNTDNVADAVSKGRNAKGSQVGTSKLTDDKVRQIRQLFKEGIGQSEIGRRFGVSHATIYHIVYGLRWKHVI